MSKKQRKTSARPSTLGQLLRRARVEAGESLKSSGPQLGVSYTYLSKIENDVVAPSSDLLARLASRYSVDKDELFAAAGRLPPDIERLVRRHPKAAADLLRRHLVNGERRES